MGSNNTDTDTDEKRRCDGATCLLGDELLGVLRVLEPAADAHGAHGVLPRPRVLDVDAAPRLLRSIATRDPFR